MGSAPPHPPPRVLVTGATGFIGAHVVDSLLQRGVRVRGATRSLKKANLMLQARPNHLSQLEFVQVGDFAEAASFDEAVKDVDGIIHVASPFSYAIKDNEKELVLPAIQGVKSILQAAATNPNIKRVIITSSFASVLDIGRKSPPRFTYTALDWNPLSYEESVDPKTSPVIAYRGSKKYAELEAWNFVKKHKPHFDIVTLCPPMTFGPVAHPISRPSELNESNAGLWNIANGKQLPVARVPFWIDVRDLARAHVEALLRPDVGNRRFTVTAPERFSYGLAADLIRRNFEWGHSRVVKTVDGQDTDDSYDLDGETAAKDLGLEYRTFEETVTSLISQVAEMEAKTGTTS
ncbi:putative 3-beta hydroxysteroid dehydrogenase isomerase family protein [Phaeomoniella chlamydospora]|uniref:Putative 3-beta hydroxysteroid dehydrogenase isomerase family protein n=1 Tax=Phaeomoniella chlamydospora TaxID=158046 RepID=A0A0G2EWP5_PHACM|nr:putative 3-beta hydroxysteroid dehydrogenase isomerase family protein [Phaeomoniella chlamydospora]